MFPDLPDVAFLQPTVAFDNATQIDWFQQCVIFQYAEYKTANERIAVSDAGRDWSL